MKTVKKMEGGNTKIIDRLSVVIIAKNEEEKIGDCIKSCVWADEVLVIDNDSIDKTASIARKLGAKVIKASGDYTLKYSKLRNIGLNKAKGKWIFYVDADERVTPKLKNEILSLLSKVKSQKSKVNSYAMPRRNIVLGKELKHGGWWPDYVKRLYLKSKLKGWKGDLHEEPEFKGAMGHLGNSLIHIKEAKLEDMVKKTNGWSELEAKAMFDANHPKMNVVRFSTAMFREFWLRFIKKQAFLDGGEGIIFGLYQVWSRFISYAKLWELQNKHDTNLRMNANDADKN